MKGILARKSRLLLTSLAVILGTAFLSGTSIFSDTLNSTFDKLFSDVFQNVDAYVRSSNTIEADFGSEERQRISADLVEVVRNIPGVVGAQPDIQAYARILGKDGKPLGGEGNGPRTSGGIISIGEPSLWSIEDGRIPIGPTEVALDSASAKEGKLNVGDTVKVNASGGTREFTLVGIANYGDVSSPGGTTYALFDQPTASEFLATPGYIDAILVKGDGSISDSELAAQISTALVDQKDIETLTGAEITKETQDQIGEALSFFSVFLNIFAFIALGVACFVIYNVFSITSAQRTRENALLRAVGASRRQVTGALLSEALVVGLIGSLLGIIGGLGLSKGLGGLLKALGIDIPSRGLTLTQATVTSTLTVGVIITLLAAWMPARRSGLIAPIAAMRDTALETVESKRSRAVLSIAFLITGLALVVAVLAGASDILLGVAVLFVFIGVLAIGPITARPLALLIGRPLSRWRGVTGTMARENAARNPKRTARTAAPVLIGVALVTAVTVLAASLRTEIRSIIGDQFRGDFAISLQTHGFGGLSPTMVDQVNKLPEVKQATGIGYSAMKINGNGKYVTVIDPKTSIGLFDLDMYKGSQSNLGAGGILVSEKQATKSGWSIGSQVAAVLADGSELSLTVEGIYTQADFSGPYVVSRDLFIDHVVTRFDFSVFIVASPDVSLGAARTAIQQVVDDAGVGKLSSRTEYINDQAAQVNQILGLIYGLLGLSVIIAVVGIVITLLLSVFERKHELGLLRAVGMSRSQIRSSIRWESVITSLIGAISGVLLGLAVGWVVIQALSDQGLNHYTFPIGDTIGILILSFAIGVVAAVYPARRATRTDILESLASY